MIIIKKIFELILIACFGLSFSSIKDDSKNEIIYIDPGHGGMDGGCEGYDGTKEKDINLEISFRLRDMLEKLGFVVELTRSGDYDLATDESNRKRVDIEKRCKLIEGCMLFISIHVNEFSDKSVRGAQVFYSNNNKEFATYIQTSLISVLKNTNRTELMVKNKYLLNNISSTGCLVEVGFMSNSVELAMLKTPEYQDKICYAICYGILQYLNK